VDTYGLAVSNSMQLQRLHAFTINELQRLGSDLDEDAPLPGVSADVLDEFQQAFYALGALLHEKLPGDKQAEGAFNKCAGLIGEMVGQLMGHDEDEDDYDDDSDDDSDDDGDTDGDNDSDDDTPSGEEPASSEPTAEPPKEPETAPSPQES
jgi:hypothetical protein